MRKLLILGTAISSSALLYDYNTREQIILRNLRTVRCGLNILYQYKIRFNAENADSIHELVAKDIYEVCHSNDGLYVKFGQGMASVDHVLPPAYFKWLQLLQDKAKQVPYDEVLDVIRSEFQRSPEEIFEYIDEKAIASASIAQVHKAKLRTGEVVALKVQKPNIAKQFAFDMFMHWVICGVVQYAFDLPLLEFQQSIEDNLRKEIDFRIERDNGEMARVALTKCNRSDVYIPKNYLWSQRILVSEWIDGIKITHTDEINRAGLSSRKALQSVIECFAEQIFVTGFVHCDPHPGNIFVRRVGDKQQVVLLDFGLCIRLPNHFRLQYARFWQSLFLQDTQSMKSIVKEWGIGNEDLFASMQLMKPFSQKKLLHSHKVTKEEVLQMQLQMKADFKKVMQEVHLFPKELLFVNRNMNLVRSVNKRCGSLVNRVNVMARFAAQGTKVHHDILESARTRLPMQFGSFWFETRLFLYGLVYRLVTIWMRLRGQRGFEDYIDQKQQQQMKEMYGQYGFRVPDETTYDA